MLMVLLLQANKLKAALSQYRQNQPSQKELLQLDTSQRTPDSLTKKASLSARKSVKLEPAQQLSNFKASDSKVFYHKFIFVLHDRFLSNENIL